MTIVCTSFHKWELKTWTRSQTARCERTPTFHLSFLGRERGRAGFTQLPPNPTRRTSVVSIAPDVPLAPVSQHRGLLLSLLGSLSLSTPIPLQIKSNTHTPKKRSFALIKPYCLKTQPKHPALSCRKERDSIWYGKNIDLLGRKVNPMLILEERWSHPTLQVEVLLHSQIPAAHPSGEVAPLGQFGISSRQGV